MGWESAFYIMYKTRYTLFWNSNSLLTLLFPIPLFVLCNSRSLTECVCVRFESWKVAKAWGAGAWL